jgi:hypothetical protein
MKSWTFLADYRQFKAGDVITGYREDLQMGTFVDENVVTSVDGNEVLIPLKFLAENSGFLDHVKRVETLTWILILIAIIAAFFIVKKLAR